MCKQQLQYSPNSNTRKYLCSICNHVTAKRSNVLIDYLIPLFLARPESAPDCSAIGRRRKIYTSTYNQLYTL